MKIDPTAPQRPSLPRRAGAAGAARGNGFAKALADAGPAAAPNGSGPIGALNAMLSIQEVPDALDSRGRAKRRGEQMLDGLERIRLGLLSGTVSRAELTALAQTVRSRRALTDDPRLAEILDEIELRAAVELAKFAQPG